MLAKVVAEAELRADISLGIVFIQICEHIRVQEADRSPGCDITLL